MQDNNALPPNETPVASATDGAMMGLLALTSALGLHGLMQAYRYTPSTGWRPMTLPR